MAPKAELARDTSFQYLIHEVVSDSKQIRAGSFRD